MLKKNLGVYIPIKLATASYQSQPGLTGCPLSLGVAHSWGRREKNVQSSSLPFLNPSLVLSDILAPEVPGGVQWLLQAATGEAQFPVTGGHRRRSSLSRQWMALPDLQGCGGGSSYWVREHRELWATAGAAPCVHVCACVQGTGGGYGVKQARPCRVWFVHNRVWYSQPLAPRGSTHILFRYPDCVRCPHFLSRRKERIILTVIVTHPLEARQDPLPAAVAGSRFASSNGVISCLFQIALSFAWLFFAGACSLWDLSSLTRYWTLGHSNSENAESYCWTAREFTTLFVSYTRDQTICIELRFSWL